MQFFRVFAALIGLFLLPVAASADVTELTIEANADYRHPHSGIVVPATLGGMARTGGKQYAADSLDVSVSFDTKPLTEVLTVYIYRNVSGDVPVWFDKARWAIENRGSFGTDLSPDTVASFALPGQGVASGLSAIYKTKASQFQSTGIRLVAVEDWYVKIRASSASRSPAELATWIEQVTQQLRRPDTAPAAVAIAEIQPCATPLVYSGTSKPVKQDMMALLIGAALLGNLKDAKEKTDVAEEEPAAPPPVWCRDGPISGGNIGIYRANGATDAYLLTTGDNGPSVRVGVDGLAGLLSDKKKPKPQYSVNLILVDKQVNFPAQDRLPDPQRAINIVNTDAAVGRFNTWGDDKTVTVGPGAMEK